MGTEKKRTSFLYLTTPVPAPSPCGHPCSSRDWSDLPGPALYLVMERMLPSLPDLHAVGRVCWAWRSAFTSCKRKFLSSLPPPLTYQYHTSCAPLCERADCCWRFPPLLKEYSHGNFILMVETAAWGSRILSWGGWQIRIEDPFNLGPGICGVELPIPRFDISKCTVRMTAPPRSSNCVVLALQGVSVQYCRPGDAVWKDCIFRGADGRGKLWRVHCPRQVVVLNGKIYALSNRGNKILAVDSFFPKLKVTVLDMNNGLPHPHGMVRQDAYLVESKGEILYVYDKWKDIVSEAAYVVYRLDVARREWSRLLSLGDDRCLFLSRAPSPFSWDPAKWRGDGDCIYSMDPEGKMIQFRMEEGRASTP